MDLRRTLLNVNANAQYAKVIDQAEVAKPILACRTDIVIVAGYMEQIRQVNAKGA